MDVEITECESVERIGEPQSSTENLSLQDMIYLVNTQLVDQIETKLRKEFTEVQERNGKVRHLHNLLKAINAATDSKGNLDISQSPELQAMIKEANELYGLNIPADKTKFNGQERERLVENIRTTCDDLNVQSDLQLQTISRLNSERQEAYQIARSMMKAIHDDIMHKAQAMSR